MGTEIGGKGDDLQRTIRQKDRRQVKKDATLVFPHHNQLKWQYQILPSLVAEKCSLEKLCYKRSDGIIKLLTKRGSVDDGAAKSQQPEPAATSNFCYQGQQVTSAPATTTTLRHTDG